MAEVSGEVLDKVRGIIAGVMRKPAASIGENSSLIDDLDCVSIDFVDMVFEIEDVFHVDLSKNAYDCLVGIFGENALAEKDLLTDFGAEILRARMPDIAPERIIAGMSIYDIPKMLTPKVWARAIEELLAARPQKCPSCGATTLDFSDEEIVCTACDDSMPHPLQEDVIRAWAEPYLGGSKGSPRLA